jgi:malate dehydrogenase (oxaloacetate-decarboxylating)(NADP+)
MRNVYVFSDLATTYPEPKDKSAFIAAQRYNYLYTSALPAKYGWPKL